MLNGAIVRLVAYEGCDLFAAVYKFADGHSPQAIYCLALKPERNTIANL
jgi:hypothetical protein